MVVEEVVDVAEEVVEEVVQVAAGEPSTVPLERICLRQLGILQPYISYFRTENSYTSANYEIRRKWAGHPN